MSKHPLRAMWLLNHGTARRFEVPMLQELGVTEIFLPKIVPSDPNFRSASIDHSYDAGLTIPPADLRVLNDCDWYGEVPAEAWRIANDHFRILFFIAHRPEIFASVSRGFKGAVIWRAYGLDKTQSYTRIMRHSTGGLATLEMLGRRFWFGQAYDHLHRKESRFLQGAAVYLPIGMATIPPADWIGSDNRLLFVCPDIGTNTYYKAHYHAFKRDFGAIPHAIGGEQTTAVADPAVLGFLPAELHRENLRRFRVMYYHSTEPNHIHFHPFEAVAHGMPLIFRSGGMLDRMGGKGLPGRCRSTREARRKIQRIMSGDDRFVAEVRASQVRLLESMGFERAKPAWKAGLERIMESLGSAAPAVPPAAQPKRRIAVILPVAYRGGTLRGAKLVAEAIAAGSKAAQEDAEVVLAHPDKPGAYGDQDFTDVPKAIAVRPYHWRKLTRTEAQRAMYLAGHPHWRAARSRYVVPDDGIQQFCDCHLWVVISDRLVTPLLPVRPYAMVVYDYVQRYVDVGVNDKNTEFFDAARAARRVLVTTDATRRDAIQFAGLDPSKVARVPMLAPRLALGQTVPHIERSSYFLWPTNAAPHKNHSVAFQALLSYYQKHQGRLKCCITGVDSASLMESSAPHLRQAISLYEHNEELRANLEFLGEISESQYLDKLGAASFLWHPTLIDNGTFSVLEAAQMAVPCISSDYPAMREIDRQFNLDLVFADRSDPEEMALKLKHMEASGPERERRPVDPPAISEVEKSHGAYWSVLRGCL